MAVASKLIAGDSTLIVSASKLIAGALKLIAGASKLIAGASTLTEGDKNLFAVARFLFLGIKKLIAEAISHLRFGTFLVILSCLGNAFKCDSFYLCELWAAGTKNGFDVFFYVGGNGNDACFGMV